MSKVRSHIAIIKASKLFDRDWYLEQYPDVGVLGIDPVEHYVRFGARLHRNPHPLFNTGWYATHHADIARTGVEPLFHFLTHGQFEGRKTLPVGGSHPTYALCVDRKGGIDRRRDHWDAAREAGFVSALAGLRSEGIDHGHGASVIMPTYNRAEVIASAIKSVVAQTHQTWELLVVDDGSTDDTESVVAPMLADPRIHYIRQSQGGVAKARNTGLRAAVAPYVFYLDSDNTWRDDFLATMIAYMTATGLGAAYAGSCCYDDSGHPPHYRGDDFSWMTCLQENYVDMNGFGHRRELPEKFGAFDETLLRLVDWDFILRLTRETSTAYAPFCGVRYYDGSGGGRITQTHYLDDGMLEMVASRIRAKHPHPEAAQDTRATAEELLKSAAAGLAELRLRAGYSSSWAPYDRRIGYVVWDWPAQTQTFVLNEIRTLIARGADVTVYYKTAAETGATLDFEVPAYPVDDPHALAALVREHGRTVLHSPFAYPATTLMTWPCSMETGIPFTFMPGGVDISHYANMKRNRVGEVASSPNCLGVITLGNYHRDFLIEQGVPADKIVLERQAVALPDFRPRYPMAARPRVICIARFIEKKGIAYLLDAAASIPGADFHLYGYGPLEGDLRERARRLGLSNVHFENPPTNAAVLHAAYRHADIFVLPCVRAANGDLDGLPTVILEAMASGVPVVSNRISNIPDVIVDGATGLLATPGDAASLATKLAQAMAQTSHARRAMIDAARKLVEGYASDERTVTTLERIWAR